MEIICLIGLNGSGKSTAAKKMKEILEDSGKKVCIKSLAKPLKIIAESYLGYDESKKRDGHRAILESFGEDLKKYLGMGIFAYSLLDNMDAEDASINYDYVIIDDVRHPIEIEVIGSFNTVYTIEIDCKKHKTAEFYDLKRLSDLKKYLGNEGYTIFVTDPKEDLSPILMQIEEGY